MPMPRCCPERVHCFSPGRDQGNTQNVTPLILPVPHQRYIYVPGYLRTGESPSSGEKEESHAEDIRSVMGD